MNLAIVIGIPLPKGQRQTVVLKRGESIGKAWTATGKQTNTTVKTLQNKYRLYGHCATISRRRAAARSLSRSPFCDPT